MTWPARALFSIDELKRVAQVQGAGSDLLLADIAGWAVDDLERYLGRRLVYRAPTEDDDAIYSGTYANGTPAPAGQPGAGGRTLVVSFPAGASAGTLTVTGTVAGVAGTVRTFNALNGVLQYGLDFFTAISGLAIAGANPASGTIKVGTSGGYVEFHSPNLVTPGAELTVLEWPVYQAIVYEDSGRVYASALATTDYVVADRSERPRLVRLAGSGTGSWECSYRAVKLVYSAGYAGAAAVPGRIKRVALRLGAMLYQEATKGQIEIASGSSPMGTWARTGPATLTREMRDSLRDDRSRGSVTAERDFDLEAA